MSQSYLLDTHVLLWWFAGSDRISDELRATLEGSLVKYVSVASLWEIVIKIQAKKLDVSDAFFAHVQASEYVVLPVTVEHVGVYGSLPLMHKDPFDRMMIAQAMVERATLVSADKMMWAYDVPLLRVL